MIMMWIKPLVGCDRHLVEPSWFIFIFPQVLKLLQIIWIHVFNHSIINFLRLWFSIFGFGNEIEWLQILNLLCIKYNPSSIPIYNSHFIFFLNWIITSCIINDPLFTSKSAWSIWFLWKTASLACIVFQVLFGHLKSL